MSSDISDLFEYQKEVKKHLKNVEKKIFSLEQSYLDETPGGNVIRGWDGDTKPLLNKKGAEPKERVFSNSSYHVYQDYKPIMDELAVEAKIHAANAKALRAAMPVAAVTMSSEPKKKKKRKARKDINKSTKVAAAAGLYAAAAAAVPVMAVTEAYDDGEWLADYWGPSEVTLRDFAEFSLLPNS